MTMTAAAHPDARVLEAYALGTLEFDEVSSLEEHLTECENCCAMLNNVSEDSFLALIRKAAVVETCEPAGDETMLLSQAEGASSPQDDFGLVAAPGRSVGSDDAESIPRALLDHGRYRILSRCGSGGMGVVYRAEHRLMRREVALKVIRPHLLRRSDAVDRFRREVRAAALLSHPNIVSAYDAEEADGSHFLVMEYVAGSDLASLVAQQGPLSVRDACDYIRQAAEGLVHAHERGMVHRDVKPQNLMLTPDGRIKILDFGLSKFASETEIEEIPTSSSSETFSGNASLTSASTSLGTPDYVAPEQTADTSQADVRADIYGLGCTLYFLLTGRPPFPGSSLVEKLKGHAEGTPRAVSDFRDDVPPALIAVLDRMTAKRPDDRHQIPSDIAEALRPFIVEIGTEGVGEGAPPASPPGKTTGEGDFFGDARSRIKSASHCLLWLAGLTALSFVRIWFAAASAHHDRIWDLLFALSFLGVPAIVVMIHAGLKMRRLEGYRWAVAAAILALVPWSGIRDWLPLFGVPTGLFALWTLGRPDARRLFGRAPLPMAARRRGVLIILLLTPLAAGAGGIVFIETDRGEIAIEAHDPDARIRVLKGGKVVEVLDPITNESVTVDTGVYTIQLGSSGFSTSIPEDKEFVVRRGKRKVVTVRRVEGTPPEGTPPEGTTPASMDAVQILDRMAEVYRDCDSYSDSGVVKTVFIKGAGKRTVEKPFATAFIRPDRFRFEFRNWVGGEERRYIVWRNKQEVRTWWDIKPQVQEPESLSRALGAAVGVSDNSSRTIPALLLPDELGSGMLTSLNEAKRIENAKLDGVDCLRIEGTYARKVPLTLWIDARSFLVRRIDERKQFDDFRTETTTTYDPAIDIPISDRMLEFDAENAKAESANAESAK